MKIISIDFECANTYLYHSIFWAGIVECDEKFKNQHEYEVVLNPQVKKFMAGGMSFPFTIAELATYPTFRDAHDKILGHLTPDTLVLGHSLHNDINMLLLACRRAGIACPSFSYIDSNVLFSCLMQENGEYSLSKLADHFGLALNAHNPLEDARITLRCVEKICAEKGLTLPQLLNHFQISTGWVEDSLLIKSASTLFPPKALHKVQKTNALYRQALEKKVYGGKLHNKYFAFDKDVIAQYDLTFLADNLLADGARFVDNPKICTHFVTNRKKKDDNVRHEYLNLEALIKWYVPLSQYKKYRKQIFDKSFDYENRQKKEEKRAKKIAEQSELAVQSTEIRSVE